MKVSQRKEAFDRMGQKIKISSLFLFPSHKAICVSKWMDYLFNIWPFKATGMFAIAI